MLGLGLLLAASSCRLVGRLSMCRWGVSFEEPCFAPKQQEQVWPASHKHPTLGGIGKFRLEKFFAYREIGRWGGLTLILTLSMKSTTCRGNNRCVSFNLATRQSPGCVDQHKLNAADFITPRGRAGQGRGSNPGESTHRKAILPAPSAVATHWLCRKRCG